MQHQVLVLQDAEGRQHACAIAYSRVPPYRLALTSEAAGDHSVEGPDQFENLATLRRTLEPKGLLILCNGARVDAWATAMSRQMGGGTKVYLLRMGEQAVRRALVNTFDPCDGALIGTVDEQKAYFLAWTRSIGMRLPPSPDADVH